MMTALLFAVMLATLLVMLHASGKLGVFMTYLFSVLTSALIVLLIVFLAELACKISRYAFL